MSLTHKPIAIIIALSIAAMAVAAPILLAVELSRQQGLQAETSRALTYARDIIERSDTTADQIDNGISRLTQAQEVDPCSEANLALMRQIDLSSSYIQAMGYIVDNHLLCTSLGLHQPGIFVGPSDLRNPNGVAFRYDVTFPFAEETTFILVERENYIAVIHKQLPIDITMDTTQASLALYTLENRRILTSNGFINPEWLDELGEVEENTFSNNGYIVAVVKSKKYLTGAIAAVPVSHLDQQTRIFAVVLVPIGVVAGLVLALTVLYLARAQLAMPAVLRAALRRNEFFVVYQPIVDLQTGNWVGAEALIRWRRPNGEFVRPDLFIPVAEDSGLIQRLTERVVEMIGQEAADLFQRHPQFHIAINLSSIDLRSKQTVEIMRRLIRRTGAAPQNLLVEATERGFMHMEATRDVIRELRAAGVRVAIDDFGTGYSSLAYLETFELDFLKIDRSFVNTIGTQAPTSRVVFHIIEMAKALKLQMIAEGVETDAQAQFLRNQGVQLAQGWLFCKPIEFTELAKRLSETTQAEAPPETPDD